MSFGILSDKYGHGVFVTRYTTRRIFHPKAKVEFFEEYPPEAYLPAPSVKTPIGWREKFVKVSKKEMTRAMRNALWQDSVEVVLHGHRFICMKTDNGFVFS